MKEDFLSILTLLISTFLALGLGLIRTALEMRNTNWEASNSEVLFV